MNGLTQLNVLHGKVFLKIVFRKLIEKKIEYNLRIICFFSFNIDLLLIEMDIKIF